MSNVLNKFSHSYSRVIGISPTGWNNSPKPHELYVVRKQGFITIYGLPYRCVDRTATPPPVNLASVSTVATRSCASLCRG